MTSFKQQIHSPEVAINVDVIGGKHVPRLHLQKRPFGGKHVPRLHLQKRPFASLAVWVHFGCFSSVLQSNNTVNVVKHLIYVGLSINIFYILDICYKTFKYKRWPSFWGVYESIFTFSKQAFNESYLLQQFIASWKTWIWLTACPCNTLCFLTYK